MQHVAVLWMIISWLDNVSSENGPESMQQQYWSERFSVSFHLLLPVAGLGFLLFGRKHIFPQLLVQIDKNCVSVLCPSLSKREKLIKWACQRLPSKWSSHSSKTLSGGVAELWSDGSLLCTLINTAIPGACPNPHRHWKQPPSHAQAIAYKYLGVVPIFNEEDLAGNLTSNFERTFIHYLCEIQQSINKITENADVERIFCSDYIARGLGLFSGEQHQKTVFYVYPDDFENSEPSTKSVIINIKGPFGTFGHALISNIQNSPAKNPPEGCNISVSNDTKTKSEFMRKFSCWFLKHSKEVDEGSKNIIIDVTLEKNRAKVSYIPNNYGMHEINLICNGELLKGCPFNVHIFSNETKTGDTMDNEEKVEGLRHYQKRKIISEMVDLVDEKISFSELEEKYHLAADDEIEKKEPIKSTFNFREVVEEITKNDEVFKNMFNVDIDDGTCKQINGSNKHEPAETEKENDTQHDEQTKTNENSVENNSVCSVPTNEDIDELDSTAKHGIEDDHSDTDVEFRELNDLSQSWEPNYNVEIQMPVIDEVDEAPDLNENLDTGDEKSESTSEKKIHIPFEIESTQESLEYVSRQTQGLTSKVNINNNNDSLNKPVIITSDNITENTHVNDLIFTDDIMNIGQQLDEDYKKMGHRFSSKYINSNINKIEIPAEFLENEKNIATNKMDINADDEKYFHKTHHEPNLSNIECEKTEDMNNNNLSTEHATLKKHYEILNQRNISEKRGPVISCQPLKPHLASNTKDTSPICSEHIVHEVKYSQISVAERRKIFAQSFLKSTSSSKNSSFSENESVEVSTKKKHHQIAGLSVLNVLDSLRKSVHTSNDESFSLSSTVSLPNISLESDYLSLNVVKEKKTYWENISMSSSSSSRSIFPKIALKKNISEEERDRLIWKKPAEPNTTETTYVENDMYRSADDILAMTESLNHQHSKDFKSVDGCLDKYEMLTIEERKQKLLKQNYEKEKIARERIMRSKKQNLSRQTMKKNDQFQNYLKPRKVLDQNGVFISPVMEKIRKFDSASNLSRVEVERKEIMKPTTYIEENNSFKVPSPQSCINKEHDSNIVSKPEPKIRYRSQFNRAIRYFKKLEEKSQGKPKSKISKKSKQFSLDIHPKRDRKRKRGGSLNITERFSIENLYEDITQNKKGSLKGTPNRTALVEALATFSRIENNYYSFCGNEDDIKYDIFKNLGHIKKRKSLKSIFDVYY